jgi:hypothetical protein
VDDGISGFTSSGSFFVAPETGDVEQVTEGAPPLRARLEHVKPPPFA